MRILLASCNIEIIKTYAETGIFAGVITNPHVVAEEKRSPGVLFKDILNYVPYAYYQVDGGSVDDMLDEAHRMVDIHPDRMRIKVPATLEGFKVMSRLIDEKVHVMATCIPTQAWMIFAIECGATEFSPYSGMLQKMGFCSKREEILKMQNIIDKQGYQVEICTGIYDVTDLPFYAEHGVTSCFFWGKDVKNYLTQPLVNEAVEGFKKSFEDLKKFY